MRPPTITSAGFWMRWNPWRIFQSDIRNGGILPPLRMMPVAKYCVFYRVVGDTVRVVHIRYAGRTPFRLR